MATKYVVRLDAAEQGVLRDLVNKGKTQAYRIKHANILLAVDANGSGDSDEEVAESLGCHKNTVANVRKRFVERGLEAAIERKKQVTPSRQRILDGEKEAKLLSIACSQPPEGRARWTLKMLADELVALQCVDAISDQTVRRTLKKTNSSHTFARAG